MQNNPGTVSGSGFNFQAAADTLHPLAHNLQAIARCFLLNTVKGQSPAPRFNTDANLTPAMAQPDGSRHLGVFANVDESFLDGAENKLRCRFGGKSNRAGSAS